MSTYKAISSIAKPIKYLLDEILTSNIENSKRIFTPNLTWKDALDNRKTWRTRIDDLNTEDLPLFSWKRSVALEDDILFERNRRTYYQPIDRNDLTVDVIKAYSALISMDFQFLTNSMSQFEEFEIKFNTSIAPLKAFYINYLGIESPHPEGFKYTVDWDGLSDMELDRKNASHVRAINFSCTLRGPLLLMDSGYPYLHEICNFFIDIYNGEELSAFSILTPKGIEAGREPSLPRDNK